ncbi:MAG: 50S ribosomal protein L21 [Candidatus Korobacteraceae bacterium]|jgi:large subunit ribosomal protein L21
MYAVIRAGGKQYRVAPGDVVKIEKTSNSDQKIEFEVLAVSGEEGKIAKAEDAKVIGEVLGEGRADKILVFHFKRKKQYKKLNGHRQPFTQVRIAEISVGGESFKAPEVAVKAPKAAKKIEGETAPAAKGKTAKKKTAKKAPVKKAAAKKKTAGKKASK